MVRIPGGSFTFGEPTPSESWHQPGQVVELGAYCMDRFEFPNVRGQRPRASASWTQAEEECRAGGKRLCSSMEWERACEGPEGQRYVYGPTRDASICNTPIEGGGPGKGRRPPYSGGGDFPQCLSAEGVYDLNGSMSEWVSDPWTGAPEPFNSEAIVDPATWRTLRGGTMWSHTFYGQDCTSRHGHPTSFQNMDDGFRCCSDPS